MVIHRKSRIGDYCSLHVDNCIVNDGKNDECPVIGANVDIGVEAKIIGGEHIADGCKIGADAVAVNAVPETGSVIGGVPARKLSDADSADLTLYIYKASRRGIGRSPNVQNQRSI